MEAQAEAEEQEGSLCTAAPDGIRMTRGPSRRLLSWPGAEPWEAAPSAPRPCSCRCRTFRMHCLAARRRATAVEVAPSTSRVSSAALWESSSSITWSLSRDMAANKGVLPKGVLPLGFTSERWKNNG